jgi:hypothetical protein
MVRRLRCRDCDQWRQGFDPIGNVLHESRGTCVHKLIDVKHWKNGRKRPEAPFHVTRDKTACKWNRPERTT